MSGDVSINGGRLEAEFSATKAGGTEKQKTSVNSDSENGKQEQDEEAEVPRQRGLLGIQLNARDGQPAEITAVNEGSGADEAGLKVGDTITSIDGSAVSEYAELRTELRKRFAGDKVKVEVERDGETKEFEVTLRAETEEQRELLRQAEQQAQALRQQQAQRQARGNRGGNRGGGNRPANRRPSMEDEEVESENPEADDKQEQEQEESAPETRQRGFLGVQLSQGLEIGVVVEDSGAEKAGLKEGDTIKTCLLYTSPSPRDRTRSRMPSSA